MRSIIEWRGAERNPLVAFLEHEPHLSSAPGNPPTHPPTHPPTQANDVKNRLQIKQMLAFDINFRYHKGVKKRYRKMVQEIFAEPPLATFKWGGVEKLLRKGLGATLSERAGGRFVVLINDRIAVFCRGKGGSRLDQGSVKDLRRFLQNSGVGP